jgi:5-methylcytosine-specific restriction protein A
MAARLQTLRHKLKPSARTGVVVVKPKQVDQFYHSAEWKALMTKVIKERGRRCQDKRHDPTTPRDGVRLYGDHVIEISDGGAKLDPSNVLLRCAVCHGRKTTEARTARYRGEFEG